MNYYAPVASTSRQASEVAAQIFQRQNLDKTHILDNIYNKSNDELWIETWLQQNNIYRPLPSLRKINVPPNAITIHQAKMYLSQCVSLLGQLNEIQQNLDRNVATMSSVEWKQNTIKIGAIKDDFTKIMCKFDIDDVLKYLKVCVKKRNKKRLSDRKRKDEKILKKREQLENEKRLSKEIDQWLNSKKQEVEKAKMEEDMQKDADLVLSEVTKKKCDARKQLSLITALAKLRAVRESTANQRGEKSLLEDKRAFAVTTDKLTKMWENSMRVYSKEEQGLKLMLEKNQSEDSKQARLARERRLVEEWKDVLFGPAIHSKNPTFWALTASERDLETFVAIRKSWDTFLVSPNNENGSKMPPGWVLPPDQHAAGEAWTRYLNHTNAF